MMEEKKTNRKKTESEAKTTIKKTTTKKPAVKRTVKKVEPALEKKEPVKEEPVKEVKNEVIEEKHGFSTLEVVILIFITCFVTIGLTTGVYRVLDDNVSTPTNNAVLDEFIENYNYIVENYYGQIDQKTALNGAIKGLLEAIDDDYTTIITEEEEDQYNIRLEGSYRGLGIEIVNTYDLLKDDNGTITGYIYKDIEVTSVFPDSPADKAGLKVGDIITHVNDISMEGKLTSELTAYVKSTSGALTLKVKREGKEMTFKASSTLVTIPSVTTEYINKDGKKVAFIDIELFAANTDEQFIEALDNLDKDTAGLIIDVRENSGGHLESVANMLSAMMDKTHVIYELETKGDIVKTYSDGNKTLDYKVAVLINGNSASASELLAISLKESYGATLVGTKSFGKGTVQKLLTIYLTGEQYKVTTQKWLSPNGNSVDKVGIEPDVKIELSGTLKDFDTDSQINSALDTLLK